MYLLKEKNSSEKFEFLDGEIISKEGAKPNHVAIVSELAAKISNGLSNKQCKVFVADLRLKVDRNYFYPDIQIYCSKPNWVFDKIRENVSGTNPTVIIEIRSETTWNADIGKKVTNYSTIPTLQEYVALHSISKFCIKHTRVGEVFKKDYYKSLDDVILLKSVGFSISIGDIYKPAIYPNFFE